MTEVQCSLVIPAIPRHFRYLKELLSELARENKYVGEIHICASSVNQTNLLKLQKIVTNSSFKEKILIHSTLEMKTAGENRNYGWNKANFEFVVFLDADDSYHPRRLEFVTEVMLKNRADAVVHDYYRMTPRFFFWLNEVRDSSVILADELIKFNLANLENTLPDGNLYAGESNLILPTDNTKKYRVHHGHLTVRRDIPIRYTNRRLGEDGELVSEILRTNFNLVFLASRLSIYDRLNWTNFFSSMKGHTLVRLSKIYRLFYSKEM